MGPADYSCLCMRTAPTGGAAIDVALTVAEFLDGSPFPSVTVRAYRDNVVTWGTCSTPTCAEGMTSALGEVHVGGLLNGWMATHVLAEPGPTPATTAVDTIRYNLLAAGGPVEAQVVSVSTINLIPTVLGFRREAGSEVLIATVIDCAGRPVQGAHLQVVTSAGVAIPEGMLGRETHYKYFDGTSFPSATQPYTHVDGMAMVANLRAGPGLATVEVWGRLPGGGGPSLVAAEHVMLMPDTVTIVDATPLRR